MPTSLIVAIFCLAVVLAVIWVEHRYPEDEG